MLILEELGYRINYEILGDQIQKSTGRTMTEEVKEFYELAAPYIVKGYDQGREGKTITELYPFLESIREEAAV